MKSSKKSPISFTEKVQKKLIKSQVSISPKMLTAPTFQLWDISLCGLDPISLFTSRSPPKVKAIYPTLSKESMYHKLYEGYRIVSSLFKTNSKKRGKTS